MELSLNDLQIIKEMLEHYWEEYRPEGDQTGLYERVLEKIKEQSLQCPTKQ